MEKREGTLGAMAELMPPPPRPSARRVVVRAKAADPDALLQDAREAMGRELARLKRQADGPSGLNPGEVRSLALLADAACKLAREEREAAKADDMGAVPLEELLRLARAAIEDLEKKA